MAVQTLTDINRVRVATQFEDCLRRCERCGIGASNGVNPDAANYIHRDPVQNIPVEIRDGAAEALDLAVNIRNRKTKRRRFGFSTSEDAVTWVVFVHLLRSGQLLRALEQIGVVEAGTSIDPALLLWGSPIDGNSQAMELRERIIAECDTLSEDTQNHSEPDVIVDLGPPGWYSSK